MQQPKILILFAIVLFAIPAWADVDGTTSVKESVIAGVKHHPQIKSLLHNRQAQENNLAASLGRFFPSLDLTSSVGLQNYNSESARQANTRDKTRTASDNTLQFTQNVFDGMDRYNDYKGSEARLTSAEYRLMDNVETVALDAIRAHVDVVRIRKLVTLAEENISAHMEVLESIAERVAGGAGSKADEMQARGRVARAETTHISYTGDLRTAIAQYFRVTGTEPGPLTDPEYHPEYIPETVDAIMERTMNNNPKIQLYKAEVEASDRDRKLSQATFYPNVDLEVSSRYTDHLDGSETYLQDNRAMVAFSWNIFNGTTDYHRSKTADERVKQSESDLQDIMDDTTRQVSAAWAEYETSVAQVDKHMEALEYSMESRDMYLMQFNVGQRSLLDVLDSINEVFSNSVLLETATSNRNFSLYKFLTLEGDLIKTLEVKDTNWKHAGN